MNQPRRCGIRTLGWSPWGVELVEDDDTGDGAVFVWGNATWCWAADDESGRRLAAMQLVTTATAAREGAKAFEANENTVWRWRKAYVSGGVTALASRRRGPQAVETD